MEVGLSEVATLGLFWIAPSPTSIHRVELELAIVEQSQVLTFTLALVTEYCSFSTLFAMAMVPVLVTWMRRLSLSPRLAPVKAVLVDPVTLLVSAVLPS